MEIIKLKPIGYCYGVRSALDLIKEVKKKHFGKNVYVFGMLVHNNDVVTELSNIGVTTIDTTLIDKKTRLEQFTSNDIVVFTAHGHDKKYEEILNKNGVIFYDATCKNVDKNMELIRKEALNNQVIFVGKKGHPEVEASLSISENIVLYDINGEFDYKKVTSSYPLVVNQTTLSILELSEIFKDIKKYFPNAIIVDEICSQTRIRQFNIINCKETPDLVMVVGSIHSSNTEKLYDLSKSKFSNSVVIKVENLKELKKYDLSKYRKCLITSGTSTPIKSISEIEEYLGGLNNE